MIWQLMTMRLWLTWINDVQSNRDDRVHVSNSYCHITDGSQRDETYQAGRF